MTVLEALNWANDKLKAHKDAEGLNSPMLDAEVLLACTLGVQKNWLFTHLSDLVTDEAMQEFQKLIERRLKHEPVAYITGRQEFYKRTFSVNRFVLIPRPATETLVDLALESAKDGTPDATLFGDIGTGSGAISVTLAAESRLPVIASDISREALGTAKQNAEKHGVLDLVDFRQGDLLEPFVRIFETLKEQPFEHLVLCANLPYLTDYQWQTAQSEVRDFEPHLALKAGTDGLDDYFRLFRDLKRHRRLFPARLTSLIEIDPAQTREAKKIITHNFPETAPDIQKDLEGHERILVTEL